MAKKTTRTGKSRILPLLFKLLSLYIAYSALFVCPSSDSLLCSTLHRSVDVVRPHIQPYYHHIQPVYSAARQLSPAVTSASRLYFSTVHPVVLRAQKQAAKDYRTFAKPVVDKHILVPFSNFYAQHLQLHVSNANRVYTDTISPLAVNSYNLCVSVYRNNLVPAYKHVYPRVHSAAQSAKNSYFAHAHPRLSSALVFFRDKVHSLLFVQLRLLWNQHVQPQLDKIYDRIFQFKPEHQVLQDEKSFPSEAIAKEAERKHIDSTINTATSVLGKAANAAQEKLAKEINTILSTAHAKEQAICTDYVKQLQELSANTISSIEKKILALAASDTDVEDRLKLFSDLSLDAFTTIDNRVSHIMEYADKILPRLHERIANDIQIVNNQLDDLRVSLQEEIGKEWPYLDHVTYKDWAKYHALRTDLQSRQQEIHGYLETQTEQAQTKVEEIPIGTKYQVNQISLDTHKKIKTLQSIGPKKIHAKDTKNDFQHYYMSFTENIVDDVRAAAEAAITQASQLIYGVQETPGTKEVLNEYSNSAQSAASVLGEKGQTAFREGVDYIHSTVLPAAAEVGQKVFKIPAAFEKTNSIRDDVLPLTEHAKPSIKTRVDVGKSMANDNAPASIILGMESEIPVEKSQPNEGETKVFIPTSIRS